MSARPKRAYTRPAPPSLILPDALYSLHQFKLASGLGDSSIAKARAKGVELRTLRVGRVKYVRGSDAIEFIESAADDAA